MKAPTGGCLYKVPALFPFKSPTGAVIVAGGIAGAVVGVGQSPAIGIGGSLCPAQNVVGEADSVSVAVGLPGEQALIIILILYAITVGLFADGQWPPLQPSSLRGAQRRDNPFYPVGADIIRPQMPSPGERVARRAGRGMAAEPT